MKKILPILNLLFFIGTVAMNGLANGQLVPGKTVGGISDNYPALFTPAGITFSIWGLIYLGLLGFCIFQIRDLFTKRPIDMSFRQQIGIWFILSCIFNVSWLLSWLNENLALSMLFMLGILLSLIAIYQNLGIGVKKVSTPVKWFVHIPFSIYLGWICVATIANTSAYLVSIKWSGLGLFSEIWAVIMIAVAALLGIGLGFKRKDYAFRGVFIWAFLGIFLKIKNLNFEEGQFILWTLGLSVAGLVLSMLVNLLQK